MGTESFSLYGSAAASERQPSVILSEVRLEGLETLDYLDNLQNKERCTEQGDAITFETEVDKIYLSTPTKIAIPDHEKKRTFVIRKHGLPDAASRTSWNPQGPSRAFQRPLVRAGGTLGLPGTWPARPLGLLGAQVLGCLDQVLQKSKAVRTMSRLSRTPLTYGPWLRFFHQPSPTYEIGLKKTKETLRTSYIVVWNPWDKKAKAMADFGDDEYKHMLCVEAVAIEKPITLKPGEE
ncbi:Aldose 1-/Glucose-6-phosphate 1-epimerase [Corchorus olitorius]|uniref:Aldose 1-/Glucose-6-phosphate 1-epimerase n=1 Tax=Corchorus olitorius TaxID=93759 RepID=A0A1R3IA82_9ROSI|nr:Aldose 1-/Glucose-6-phosphate 1-epimerase [Corchorus olitorius]